MRYNPLLKPCKLFTTTTQCITHGGVPGVLNKVRQDKTRQDNVLFGVLYSPMYIDFIQITLKS